MIVMMAFSLVGFPTGECSRLMNATDLNNLIKFFHYVGFLFNYSAFRKRIKLLVFYSVYSKKYNVYNTIYRHQVKWCSPTWHHPYKTIYPLKHFTYIYFIYNMYKSIQRIVPPHGFNRLNCSNDLLEIIISADVTFLEESYCNNQCP